MESLSQSMQSTNMGATNSRVIRRTITLAQVVKDAADEWSFSLLGKLISKDPQSHEKVKEEVNFRWRCYRRFHIISKGVNLFVFRFERKQAYESILTNAPWSMLGYLTCPQEYNSKIPLEDHKFISQVWCVKILNLKQIILNEKLVNDICLDIGNKVSPIGKKKTPREHVTNTVFVEVNLKEPLKRGGWSYAPSIWRKGLGDLSF